MKTGQIASVGLYRGCRLHDQQSPSRLEVVRRDIDEAFALVDIRELFSFAEDVTKAPEARLAAAELIRNRWRLAAADRRNRPDVDLALLDAEVGGLAIEDWRSPWVYGCLLDDHHRAVTREIPLENR